MKSFISNQVYIFRHGDVAHHLGNVALLPEGRRRAFQAGYRLAHEIPDDCPVKVLYSASARTSETAEEIARGLGAGLGDGNCPGRVSAPHAEPAIRNFQFILQGREFWPTDGMHPSLPASAAQNPDLQAFWDAVQDPIACWLNRPSDSWQSSHSVAMRLAAFFRSLLGTSPPAVHVLVTHSGPMRALLREGLGFDPGEPDFCESFRVDDGGVHYRDHSGPLPNPLGERRNAC